MNEDTKSLLAKLFEARVNEVAVLTREEKEMVELGKTFHETKDVFPNASQEEIQKIDQFVDEAVENISFEMGFYNEKYYKNGFSDAIKLISECLSK